MMAAAPDIVHRPNKARGGGLPLAAYSALADEKLRDKLWERWGAWRAARSKHSVRALVHDVKIFDAWRREKGHRLLPADPSAVSLFLEDEARKGLAVATIERRAGSIATLHQLADLENPCADELVKWRLSSIRRANGKAQNQALGLRIKGDVEDIAGAPAEGLSLLALLDDIDAVAREAEESADRREPWRVKRVSARDAAMISLGYDAGLRSSELVAVTLEQLNEAPDGAGALNVPFAKNDPEGEGHFRYVSAPTMERIKAWTELANITDGPVFRGMTRSGVLLPNPIASDTVARIYKKLVERFFRRRKDPPWLPLTEEETEIIAGISGHSTRVGVAQDAVAAGEDLLGVMQAFDWNSPRMPARYAAKLSVRGGAAARLHKKSRGSIKEQ